MSNNGAITREAQRLAELGYFVFPCGKDKKPLCKWKDAATNEPGQVADLFNGAALIGIYCEKSGVFALDIDNKDGRDGSGSWNELLKANNKGNP